MINKDEIMAHIKLMKEAKESFAEQGNTKMVKEMEAIIARLENELKSENIPEVNETSDLDNNHHLADIHIAPRKFGAVAYRRRSGVAYRIRKSHR